MDPNNDQNKKAFNTIFTAALCWIPSKYGLCTLLTYMVCSLTLSIMAWSALSYPAII